MSYDKPPPPAYAASPIVGYAGGSTVYIKDYLAWSIVNLFCGWGFLGFIPLIFSILCRNSKNTNDLSGAQSMSKLALITNIIVTILGLICWIIFIVEMALIISAASQVNP